MSSSTNFTPAKTTHTRVFLIEGRAAPNHSPLYMACARAGSPDQAFGDITTIQCPHPNNFGQFRKIGQIQGEIGDPTMDVVGHYAADLASTMLRLAKKRCPLDVQVHFGACTNPSTFADFQKILVIEDAYVTNWSTDELGTLDSAGGAAIDETAPIQGSDMYEILPLSFAERGESIITNEVVDVVICDQVSCGDCETESDGCEHIYAITKAAGGSPSTAADIVFTVDGSTWYADDVDSLGAAEEPTGIGCLGSYIVVISNDSASLHYALKSEVDDVDYDETWTEVTTGFVAGGEPNDCWKPWDGGVLFICGDGGYVYYSSDPVTGVTVLDAGSATTVTLNAIHARDDDHAVAVGNDGVVIYTTTQSSWTAAAGNPVGVGINCTCVWMKSNTEWWVGMSNGTLYYTLNSGTDWTLVADYGSSVCDIQFPTDTVGYLSSYTSTPRAQIRRSYNGGNTWKLLPEGSATVPAADQFNALASCPDDVNFIVAVGLADDGSDGIIVVGQD